MPLVELLLAVAVACGLWAGVSAVLIARALERQGVRTPFPFLGLFIFRNLRRYSETTRAKTGKTGPLFYSYVVPINAALILVVITVVLFLVVGWSSALAAPAPADAPQSWVEEGWAPWERELTARQQPERVMDVIGLKPGMVVARRPAIVVAARSLASSGAGQVPAPKPDGEAGFKLLGDLVLLLDKAGKGAIDTAAVNTGIVGLAKDLKAARDAKRVDQLFAVRYSRLLSAVRQGLLTDPELLYWPMYRSSMIDFIEERTGHMPDRDKLLFVVNDHGGSGVGLAMLVEPVMSEIVSLHIHLETLDRRPAILKEYLEGTQRPRGAAQ